MVEVIRIKIIKPVTDKHVKKEEIVKIQDQFYIEILIFYRSRKSVFKKLIAVITAT